MRDLFDEFMEELRRRQGTASGRPVGEPGSSGEESPGPDDEPVEDADDAPTDETPSESADEAPPGPRPTSIDERRHEGEGARGGGRGTGGRGTGGSGGSGGSGPRRPGGPDDGSDLPHRGHRGRIGIAVIVAVILVVLALSGSIVTFWTDAIWFRSVGFESVFWTRVLTQLGLFVGTLVVALIVLLGGLWLADRGVPRTAGRVSGGGGSIFDRLADAARQMEERSNAARTTGARRFGGQDDPRFERFGDRYGATRGPGTPRTVVIDPDEMPEITPIARIALVVVAILLAVGVAGSVASQWETIQLWAHQVPYAPSGPPVTDPIFGRDIGFFLFQLPFLRLLQSVATSLLVGGLLLAGARYVVGVLESGLQFTTRVRVHLAVLGGLLLVLIAVGYQLDKLELVYSNRGVATGVSYTDANAQFLAYDVLTVIAALAGAFLVGAAFTRWVWPLGLAVGAWLVASFVLGTVYPSLIQQFTVLPNQFAQEQPYIANNIAMTRLAFGLTNWSPTPFDGSAPLTQATVTAESATFQNARLWDSLPLGDALAQLQTIRQYYDFTDVDTDRYTINGQLRQVMLSARELAPEKNPQANSWVNQRITFTHGVGVAMVPVNQATPGGQPDLIIKDLPPVSVGGAPTITEPRIYFGERPSDYVIVDAKQPAFDYPVGGTTSATDGASAPPWTGTSGIRLDTTLSRLLFAIRFGDVNLLISDQITGASQLLFHRSLSDRLSLIAPFLRFDKDPYLVITSAGRLEYVQDAYTISDRFPNAQSFDGSTLGSTSGLANDSFDYIRNSVKIVMDAYSGAMTFYVADPTDPIIRAYEGIFPDLFTPLSSMPADLQAHLRVPEELFNVQTNQFATYHVTDPASFYASNDLWTVPANPGGTQSLPTEAYYVVMRLPNQPKAEFLLLQPMVPKSRPNMIAWIAARNDGPNRGQVLVYQFPQDTSVLGPNQIEAKIDAEPTISSQVSLWDQAGSKVIKGNLIVIPLQNSLIYLQPIYLQSANAAFPQLQKVVLATSSTVVWGDTLDQAMQLLLAGGFPGSNGAAAGGAGGPSPSPAPGTTPGPSTSPGTGQPLPANVQALVSYANLHFERAQAALRAGDFATYGQEMGLVQDALVRLQALTGSLASPTPPSVVPSSPAPSATGASTAP
ncbi:MAG: UPF0182 family membrane protein [Candidatus Limnocylindrales bacterium]